MSKCVKIRVRCPKCSQLIAQPIVEEDVGTCMPVRCPKCKQDFKVSVPDSYSEKFLSEPTLLDDRPKAPASLLLSTVENRYTEYQLFEISDGINVIGRESDGGAAQCADIEVETTDREMSRKHAVIQRRGGTGFTLRDAGSKNGVLLNGLKLAAADEVYLLDGDTFRLGTTEFRVDFSDDDDDLT